MGVAGEVVADDGDGLGDAVEEEGHACGAGGAVVGEADVVPRGEVRGILELDAEGVASLEWKELYDAKQKTWPSDSTTNRRAIYSTSWVLEAQL